MQGQPKAGKATLPAIECCRVPAEQMPHTFLNFAAHTADMLCLQIAGMDTVTAVPGQFRQDIHNEMSYNPEPNSKIMFICLQPAESGGENLLAKTADFTSNMSEATLQRFDTKGGVRQVLALEDYAVLCARSVDRGVGHFLALEDHAVICTHSADTFIGGASRSCGPGLILKAEHNSLLPICSALQPQALNGAQHYTTW